MAIFRCCRNSRMIEAFHLLFRESGPVPLFHPLSASFVRKKKRFFGVFPVYFAVGIFPLNRLPCRKKKKFWTTHRLGGRLDFVVSFVDAICSFFFSLPENLQVYFQGVVRGGQSVSVTIVFEYSNMVVPNIYAYICPY